MMNKGKKTKSPKDLRKVPFISFQHDNTNSENSLCYELVTTVVLLKSHFTGLMPSKKCKIPGVASQTLQPEWQELTLGILFIVNVDNMFSKLLLMAFTMWMRAAMTVMVKRGKRG